jgi:hypothetical protein
MCGVDSVRDVIAFPKTSNGEDALVSSPSLMTKSQLQDYHLNVLLPSIPTPSACSPAMKAAIKESSASPLVGEQKLALEQLHSMLSSTKSAGSAAVMVGSQNAFQQEVLAAIDIPTTFSDFDHYVGEKILVNLGLINATPAEVKQKATMWGLPVEELQQVVEKHQSQALERAEEELGKEMR